MNKQVRLIKVIIAFLIFWSVLSMLLAYGKPWIGNTQELYPGFLYPAFLRHPQKTADYLYPNYRIELHVGNSFETVHPSLVFGDHWLSKMEAVINKENFKRHSIYEMATHFQHIDSIVLIKQTKSFKDNIHKDFHPLINEKIVVYAEK